MVGAPGSSRGTEPTAATGRVAAVGAPSDIWVRTLPLWHAWNIGTLVIATSVALFAWRTPVEATAATVGLAGSLLVLYLAMFMRRPRTWGWWLPRAVPYAAAVTLCFGALLQLNPYCAYLEFSLYPQIFFLLYARRAAVAVGAIGLSLALTFGEVTLYGWRPGAAGPHIVSDLVQVAFAFILSLWIGAMARQSAERRELIDELGRARRELAAAERQAGALEERGRLAREIHDTLAQGFAGIVAHLEAAKGSLGRDTARVGRHLDEAEVVARQSLADARALAWALRPESLAAGGLTAAVERAVTSALGGSPVSASVTVTGTVRQLHPSVEVTLLRAAQEALANVRRHARAHEVNVTLSFFDDAVTLDVADDGIGFDPAGTSPGPSGGLGLLGIRERVEALGGSVAVESMPGRGTTVGIFVPTGREGEPPAAAIDPLGAGRPVGQAAVVGASAPGPSTAEAARR